MQQIIHNNQMLGFIEQRDGAFWAIVNGDEFRCDTRDDAYCTILEIAMDAQA